MFGTNFSNVLQDPCLSEFMVIKEEIVKVCVHSADVCYTRTIMFKCLQLKDKWKKKYVGNVAQQLFDIVHVGAFYFMHF